MNTYGVLLLFAAGTGILTPSLAQIRQPDSNALPPPVLVAADQDQKKVALPIQELDTQPVPLKQTMPVYPQSAVKDSTEGTVYLRVLINERGIVEEVVVEKSARKDLDEAAAACMKQWTFTPAKLKGKDVSASVVVPFRFKLSKEPVPSKAK